MKKITVENVIDIINANIKDVEITLDQCDDDLSEMGMDSITFIQIVVLLEEEFECEIPDSQLLISEMNTICLAYRFCKGGCPIKFLRKSTSDYAAWECSMVVEYWRTLFRKLWTKKDEEYFGWHLEKIHILECPEADIYKLKKY